MGSHWAYQEFADSSFCQVNLPRGHIKHLEGLLTFAKGFLVKNKGLDWNKKPKVV